jgi:hypothetical protein
MLTEELFLVHVKCRPEKAKERMNYSQYSPILEEFWTNGFRGTATAKEKELLEEVLKKTGLHKKQIQVCKCLYRDK